MTTILVAVFAALAAASAADGAVYPVPNASAHVVSAWQGFPQVAITMKVPSGMRFDPEHRFSDQIPDDITDDWFQGGGYAADTGWPRRNLGRAIPAGGFSWQKARPMDPACSGGHGWTGRKRTIGDIHICDDYCFDLVTTCLIPAPPSAVGTPGNQLETLWKPTRGGGWLVMGLDVVIRTPKTYTWNFSSLRFREALAIMKSANRVDEAIPNCCAGQRK